MMTEATEAAHCIHSDIVRWLQELADAAAPERTGDPRLTWTIEEAADRVGISRTTAYEAAEGGEFPALKIRGRWVVPRLTLLIWLLTGDPGAADLSRLIRAAVTASPHPTETSAGLPAPRARATRTLGPGIHRGGEARPAVS